MVTPINAVNAIVSSSYRIEGRTEAVPEPAVDRDRKDARGHSRYSVFQYAAESGGR